MKHKKSVVLLAALSMVAALAPAAGAIVPGQRVDLKVLVIAATGTEPSYEAWTAALNREGVPFDTVLSAHALTAGDLEAPTDHALYQAVVCVTNCAVPVLDAGELALLDAFQAKFGIRRVSGYVYPGVAYGLNVPSFSGTVDGTSATLTAAGSTVFSYLDGPVDIDDVDPSVSETYGYFATPVDTSVFTTLVAGPSASSLVGIHANPAGFEDLVVTISSNQYQLHSLLLYHGMINWVTGGVYLGYARNYFTLHIDDVFLPDDRWLTDLNCTPGDDAGCVAPGGYTRIRMTAADVDRAKAWQSRTGLTMDFVFNGYGSVEAINDLQGPDPLTEALLANKTSFRWINHTYTHENLDTVAQGVIEGEISQNLVWATNNGLISEINAAELVTGEHSGMRDPFRSFLGNPAMGAALNAQSIDWVASDNSRTPDQEPVGGALTIPRFPSNVFYNVGTQAEQLDEYNWIYVLPAGGGNCVNTATTTCFATARTWTQYLDLEADIMLPHLLTNDPRPHYFHQSNLAEDGVLYSAVDEVLTRYGKYFSAPLVQPKFAESGGIIKRSNDWVSNRSSISAYILDGQLVFVNSSGSAVDVPVTGLASGELYGGIPSEWITVATTPDPIPIDDPVVAVSGTGAVTSGTTTSYTVSTTDPHYLLFGLTDSSCGALGTQSNVVFDPATGTGSFDCSFVSSGASVVSATVGDGAGGSGTGILGVTVVPTGGGGGGGTLPTSGRFVDDDGNLHEPDIERIAALNITVGCNPPTGDMYCPNSSVTRAEMAAFIIRSLNETENMGPYQGYFPDVTAGAWYAGSVERLYELGIGLGYKDGSFGPEQPISRAEMSAFLARAFAASVVVSTPQTFADVPQGVWYADHLQKIYAKGITTGCEVNPLRYCPDDPVRRDTMASFVARALGLTG